MPAAEEQPGGRRLGLCIVIPTLNERENLLELWNRIQKVSLDLPLETTVLVVDDDSQDGTSGAVKGAMQKSERIKLIQRPKRLGIGSAYVEGFSWGLKLRFDYFGEMDADLQHPPEALPKMCDSALKGNDVVIASRYVKGGGSSGWPLSRRILSRGANFFSRVFIRTPVADSTSGYRILSSRAITGLLDYDISAKGYAFQVESLYVYKRLGMKFDEVPYMFEKRKAGRTKLRGREMVHFVYVLLKVGIFGVRRKGKPPHDSAS